MKLNDYFDAFLEGEVNLNSARLSRLNGSVTAITSFLRESPVLSGGFIDVIAQGSYAHRTIIKPVRAGDEFDADVLLYLSEVDGWEAADYVERLHDVFRASSTYKEKAHRRTRCVTLDYAGDFHIDVVPFLERDGRKWITNRHENAYELTDPEGYTEWLEEKHRTANYTLVKAIRLVKYLRNFKRTFDVKSFVLNVLLGERINDAALLADPGCYVDVPTTLRTVMNRLSEYVCDRPALPTIMDPSGTGENLSDRWDQDGYAAFRGAIMRYAAWIDDAWGETDKALSVQKWQRVFGDKFQPPVQTAPSTLSRTAPTAPVSYRNTEQSLADVGIIERMSPSYRLRIKGRVTRKYGFRDYTLDRSGSKVQVGRTLEFSIIDCSVPEPYDIFWKVKNNGEEARERDSVRGQIERRGGSRSIVEPTAFAGPHYVECYIVKNGVCVARDRQEVTIL